MNPLRITFGIIVLNGEPFTRYNLRALYPFAHQIIVVEGASHLASHMATAEGHSKDRTLEILHRFKETEDTEDKILIITAENENHPNGFWPGEKDEQSRAYARRATGDWLWQIDIDEFYQPKDMQRVCAYLRDHPQITCLTFNQYQFWGGFDYLLEGGLVMSPIFQKEPWGAFRRVFKWGPGYQYLAHRPPTVVDTKGRNLVLIRKRNMTTQAQGPPIYMYHYSAVFPQQTIPKGLYYQNQGWTAGQTQRTKFEAFLEPLDEKNAFRIFDHYGTYNWIRRFVGQHPPAIRDMRRDIDQGIIRQEVRPVEDIERVLNSLHYIRKLKYYYLLEILRSYYHQNAIYIKSLIKKIIFYVTQHCIPARLKPWIPKAYQMRIEQWQYLISIKK